jgi:hypothetical protein
LVFNTERLPSAMSALVEHEAALRQEFGKA